MTKPIYLDYNGTTPHHPEVIDAMLPFLKEEFGNPSSSHLYGVAPKRAVAKARQQVASLLGCSPEEIIFTSGGTESNNHALIGTAISSRLKGNHIITDAVEHPAVLEVCRYLEETGFEVTVLPVDEFGMVRLDELERAIRPSTILVTIMHANNEVGTLQPIAEISRIAKTLGITVHTDAAQSIGKVPVKVNDLGVDLLSVAGHKLYAPKGIGALFVRKGIVLKKFLVGAGQESGARAGTENVPYIVGLGKACELAAKDLEQNTAHLQRMRDLLFNLISAKLKDVKLNGHLDERLPNTLSLSFRGLQADRILEEIGLEVAASAGAACHADHVSISHVLEAMNVPVEWAKGTLRLTAGRMTTEAEVRKAAQTIVDAVKKLNPA